LPQFAITGTWPVMAVTHGSPVVLTNFADEVHPTGDAL